ncbi:hypothetical protein OAF18_02470 [Flavobacteriaceae bacterium]|nr:hypothetical protein [Flavobacteriaceae bacterium]
MNLKIKVLHTINNALYRLLFPVLKVKPALIINPLFNCSPIAYPFDLYPVWVACFFLTNGKLI